MRYEIKITQYKANPDLTIKSINNFSFIEFADSEEQAKEQLHKRKPQFSIDKMEVFEAPLA